MDNINKPTESQAKIDLEKTKLLLEIHKVVKYLDTALYESAIDMLFELSKLYKEKK